MADSVNESEQESEEDYETLAYQQRLKAAVHYSVGKICEETGETMGLKFSRQFIAALTETTFKQCETFVVDAEHFAKHAKRSTINIEDIKLLSRKSSTLLQHITDVNSNLIEAKQAAKNAKKPRKTAPSEETVQVEEDDSSAMSS